jgi:methylene-fatty-acyl-phospholipid synthase
MAALLDTLSLPTAQEALSPLRLAGYASIVAASAFYTWLWLKPASWVALVAPADPCVVMARVAHAIKVAQFATFAACTDWGAALAAPALPWAVLAVLVVLGQHLNMLVFHHLKVDGTYYGVRFGKAVPWVHAYPFGYIKDPQYVGSSLTLLGLGLLGPADLALFWIANYGYLAWLEASEDAATRAQWQGPAAAAAAAVAAPSSGKGKGKSKAA